MEGFRYDAHPMGMLVSTVAALSTFYPDSKNVRDAEARKASHLPPDRQDADHCRLCLPPPQGPALHLSGAGPQLHRELHEHAVEAQPTEVPDQSGAGPRAGRAVHSARRPRAELLHQRHARGGQLGSRSVPGDRGGRCRPGRSAARRRQRSRAAHARARSAARTRSPSTSRA